MKEDKEKSAFFSLRCLSDMDWALWLLVLSACAIGILGIGAAQDNTFRFTLADPAGRQLAGIAAGCLVAALAASVDYRRILDSRFFLPACYLCMIGLLMAVVLFGTYVYGARRWIMIGGISAQPSELVKFLLILFYAEFIIRLRKQASSMVILTSAFVLGLPVLFLTARQPDLSTTLVMAVIICGCVYAAGLSSAIIAGAGVCAGLLGAFVLIEVSGGGFGLLRGYQNLRILAWLHPEDYAESYAYQTINSMTAIGSGGWIGKGFAAAETQTLYRTGFVASSTTDFIFTVIGETMGFAGCVLVILLMLGIAARIFLIAFRCRDPRGSVICMAAGLWIIVQSYMNISVATGLLPNTGIPLPFISYGLSSLLSLFAAVGLVMSVRIHDRRITAESTTSQERSEE